MIAVYILNFVIFFIVSRYIFGKWSGKKNSERRFPPSLPSLPLIGSLPFLRKFHNIPEFFMEKSHQLGPMFTFRVGSKLVLTLNTKEVIEEAFVKNSRSFSSRPEIFMFKLSNPESKGIIFRDTTQEWKRIHKLSLAILKEFGFGDKSVMEERIMREVEAMIKFALQKKGKSIDPKELTTLVTSNVMMNFLFGYRREYSLGMSELMHEIEEVAQNADISFDVAPFLKYIPRFRKRIIKFQKFNQNMYHLLLIELDKSVENQENCFVTQYIKTEGTNYDRDQLKYLLQDLAGAGTDTTAVTLQWAYIALANQPEIQMKLQKEIDSVIGKDRLPTLQDQNRLPYVEATILEIFRWRTLASVAIPHKTSQDSVLGDFFIPAGTLVVANLFAAHCDPRVWKDPDCFRPERFLDKDNNVIGRDRVIPFSLGRRSCLGEILARAEIFLILTSFIQRFTILPPEGQDTIYDKPQQPVLMLLSPVAYSIRLAERN